MQTKDQPGVIGLLAACGRGTLTGIGATGELSLMTVQVLRSLLVDRQRMRVYLQQFYAIGYRSVPVIVLTGLSIGLVLAFQFFATLRVFQGETMTGAMVNYAIFTQLAPVLAGLMLAGRVGSSIAAELGSMKVTEQIDALRTMGTDPIAHLVGPRFVACVVLMPFLTAIGGCVGVLGGGWLAIDVLGIDEAAYWERALNFNTIWEVMTGLSKTLIFGGIIALVACRKGLNTRGGATGVGEACTQGVVHASIMILIANFLLTVVLERLRPVIMG